MTLYEINEAILECIDEETGEILDGEKLTALSMERDEKIENVALWYKNLLADAEAYKAEKISFYQKEIAARNKAEKVKQWLYATLAGNNFKTTRVSVNFRKTESVKVVSLIDVPNDFLRYKEPEVDKVAVRKAIKEGATVGGVVLEQATSMSIK